jgi:hypothetical protein
MICEDDREMCAWLHEGVSEVVAETRSAGTCRGDKSSDRHLNYYRNHAWQSRKYFQIPSRLSKYVTFLPKNCVFIMPSGHR